MCPGRAGQEPRKAHRALGHQAKSAARKKQGFVKKGPAQPGTEAALGHPLGLPEALVGVGLDTELQRSLQGQCTDYSS